MDLGPPKRSIHKSNSSIAFEFPPAPAAMAFSQVLQTPDAPSGGDDLDVRDVPDDFEHPGACLTAPGQETIAHARWCEAVIVFVTHLCRLPLASREVPAGRGLVA